MLVEHAEVVQEGLAVAAVEPRRHLLVDLQAEVLEDRQHLGQLHLAAGLVDADARQVLRAAALVLQRDAELLAGGQVLELLDVDQRHRDVGRVLVVVGEPLAVGLGEPDAVLLAVDGDEPLAEAVVPGAREGDHLVLEVGQRHVGQRARDVHREVDARGQLGLAERQVLVDGLAAEALLQQLDQALLQLDVVAVARQRDGDRDRAALGVEAHEHLDLAALLEVEQAHHLGAQVVDRGAEQVVLRERLVQGDGRLVVVRALDQVLGLDDLAQLAAEDRDAAGRLGVGLRREQPDQAQLAEDLAALADVLDADVVHPLVPVHGREPVRLRHEQQVAAGDALAQPRLDRHQRHRLAVVARRLVGEDAEAGAGHDRHRARSRWRTRGSRGTGSCPRTASPGTRRPPPPRRRCSAPAAACAACDHRRHALAHLAEVAHRGLDVAEDLAHAVAELHQLLARQAALELEVHHRLALIGLARVEHGGDAAGLVALDADHRVDLLAHREAAERRARRRPSRPGTASPACSSRAPSPAARSRRPAASG